MENIKEEKGKKRYEKPVASQLGEIAMGNGQPICNSEVPPGPDTCWTDVPTPP